MALIWPVAATKRPTHYGTCDRMQQQCTQLTIYSRLTLTAQYQGHKHNQVLAGALHRSQHQQILQVTVMKRMVHHVFTKHLLASNILVLFIPQNSAPIQLRFNMQAAQSVSRSRWGSLPSYLVDGARNKTPDVFSGSKHVRKGIWERWRSLDGREGDLPDVVLTGEPKDPFHLVQGHTPVWCAAEKSEDTQSKQQPTDAKGCNNQQKEKPGFPPGRNNHEALILSPWLGSIAPGTQ